MYYFPNKKTAINFVLIATLTTLVFIFNSALSAQTSTVKVYKASSSDTISVKSSNRSKLRVLSSSADQKWMDEINPDDIASMDVIKKDGKGYIKITLKNGDVIEKEVSDSKGTTKSKVMTVVFDADENNDQSNYMKWKELEGIDPDEIKSVDVSKNDDVSVVTVTLKNGEIIEKEMENATSDKVKVFAKTIELDDISYDQLSANGNIFVYDTNTQEDDDFMKLEAFKGIDEDDVKEVIVKVKDNQKTITVTTKDGQVIEEVVELDGENSVRGTNLIRLKSTGNNMNWVSRGNGSKQGVKVVRVDQQDKIDALEQRLERMEKKLDELLKALKNADNGNNSSKKKKG